MRKSWEYTDRRRWKSPSEHVQFAIFFLIVFLGVFFWHLRPPSTTVGNQRYMTCLDSKKVSQENSSYNWYIFHNFQAYPRNHGVTINSKGISFFRQPECEPCIAKIQSHHHWGKKLPKRSMWSYSNSHFLFRLLTNVIIYLLLLLHQRPFVSTPSPLPFYGVLRTYLVALTRMVAWSIPTRTKTGGIHPQRR